MSGPAPNAGPAQPPGILREPARAAGLVTPSDSAPLRPPPGLEGLVPNGAEGETPSRNDRPQRPRSERANPAPRQQEQRPRSERANPASRQQESAATMRQAKASTTRQPSAPAAMKAQTGSANTPPAAAHQRQQMPISSLKGHRLRAGAPEPGLAHGGMAGQSSPSRGAQQGYAAARGQPSPSRGEQQGYAAARGQPSPSRGEQQGYKGARSQPQAAPMQSRSQISLDPRGLTAPRDGAPRSASNRGAYERAPQGMQPLPMKGKGLQPSMDNRQQPVPPGIMGHAAPPGMMGQADPMGMQGMQDLWQSAQSWIQQAAAHQAALGSPTNFNTAPRGGMPEAQMLPSPGLPTGPGMPMPAAAPMQWGNPSSNLSQQQAGLAFTSSVNASLQKFAAAEEVHQAADGTRRLTPNQVMSEAAREDLRFQQRLEAAAAAQATAARLLSSAAPAAPRLKNAKTKIPTAAPVEVKPEETSSPEKLPTGDERYSGRIKAFDMVQGYGFIQSADVYRLYGCDAFLNQAVEGGIVVGSSVSFSVEIVKGKPQARNVLLEDVPAVPVKDFDAPGTAVPGPQAGFYRGRVKSFNATKGFGFITSRDLQYSFGGRDAYVSKTQAPDGNLSVGQEVEFQLVVDGKGQPQAREIKKVANRGPPSMMPPSMMSGRTGHVGPVGMPLFPRH